MPVITVNDQHYALRPGQNRLGGGAGADVRVSDDEALGIQAIVDVREAAHPVIRRAMPNAAVRVNGVELVDPTPLIHGDKVEIGGNELLFSDDTKTGATRIMKASDIAAIAAAGSDASAQPLTGGRLVSLVDGKEYVIGTEGVTIGREAGSDIVVAQQDVSRKHAVVLRTEKGTYEVRDFSSNGVFVNQKRVRKSAGLSPSDLIRVGGEEFRFRADGFPAVEAPPRAPANRAPPSAKKKAGSSATPSAPSVAAPSEPAPVAKPYVPPSQSRKALATLVITNTGPTNGQKFDIRVPLVHIGRGAHNDIAINDDSVSESHAKLQRRDTTWFLIDLGSTNGTYVGGSRFTGERKIDEGSELRFGGVKMSFQPSDAGQSMDGGARQIANVSHPQLNPTTNIPAVVLMPEPKEPETAPPVPAWVWGVVVAAVVAVAVFLLAVR